MTRNELLQFQWARLSPQPGALSAQHGHAHFQPTNSTSPDEASTEAQSGRISHGIPRGASREGSGPWSTVRPPSPTVETPAAGPSATALPPPPKASEAFERNFSALLGRLREYASRYPGQWIAFDARAEGEVLWYGADPAGEAAAATRARHPDAVFYLLPQPDHG